MSNIAARKLEISGLGALCTWGLMRIVLGLWGLHCHSQRVVLRQCENIPRRTAPAVCGACPRVIYRGSVRPRAVEPCKFQYMNHFCLEHLQQHLSILVVLFFFEVLPMVSPGFVVVFGLSSRVVFVVSVPSGVLAVSQNLEQPMLAEGCSRTLNLAGVGDPESATFLQVDRHRAERRRLKEPVARRVSGRFARHGSWNSRLLVVMLTFDSIRAGHCASSRNQDQCA